MEIDPAMNQQRTGAAFPARSSFVSGARAGGPFMLAVLPFGLIYGVIAVELGFGPAQASGFSLLAFAGAAQMAAIQLLADQTPLWVAAGTALVVNLRYFMYSASLSVHLKHLPLVARFALSYLLTDQSYMASITRFAREPQVHRGWFYFGSAIVVWAAWQAGTLAGALAGARIPAALQLDFGVPLVFLGLAVPVLRDRPSLAAALVSTVTAIATHDLPLGLGLLAASGAGMATGTWLSARRER